MITTSTGSLPGRCHHTIWYPWLSRTLRNIWKCLSENPVPSKMEARIVTSHSQLLAQSEVWHQWTPRSFPRFRDALHIVRSIFSGLTSSTQGFTHEKETNSAKGNWPSRRRGFANVYPLPSGVTQGHCRLEPFFLRRPVQIFPCVSRVNVAINVCLTQRITFPSLPSSRSLVPSPIFCLILRRKGWLNPIGTTLEACSPLRLLHSVLSKTYLGSPRYFNHLIYRRALHHLLQVFCKVYEKIMVA